MTEEAMNPDECLKENTQRTLRLFVYGTLKRGSGTMTLLQGRSGYSGSRGPRPSLRNALQYSRPKGSGRGHPRARPGELPG